MPMNNTAEIGAWDFCTMGNKWGYGIVHYGIQGLPYNYDV